MNLKSQPTDGKFGTFGGKYVPETLMPVVDELEEKYNEIKENKEFNEKLSKLLKDYAGRSTPIYFAENLSKKYGGKIYFKREDLLHGGAHKINNSIGQALLAKAIDKKRIIA